MTSFKAHTLDLCGKEYINNGRLELNNINLRSLDKINTDIINIDISNIINLNWYTLGNRHKKNNTFEKAKRRFKEELYNDVTLAAKTFYCRCKYDKETGLIDLDNCELTKDEEGRYPKRTEKIEVEHVVAAYRYGINFPSWAEGHQVCVNSKGKSYKGRKCASKSSDEFNRMTSDLHVLVPMAGHKNALRSKKEAGEIPGNMSTVGCQFEVNDDVFDPTFDRRGDVARMKLYMAMTYPNRVKFDSDYVDLLTGWSKEDLISPEEAERYAAVLMLQKSINPILHDFCFKNYPDYFKDGFFSKSKEEREKINEKYGKYYKEVMKGKTTTKD